MSIKEKLKFKTKNMKKEKQSNFNHLDQGQ